jgi:hypothetical protein
MSLEQEIIDRLDLLRDGQSELRKGQGLILKALGLLHQGNGESRRSKPGPSGRDLAPLAPRVLGTHQSAHLEEPPS